MAARYGQSNDHKPGTWKGLLLSTGKRSASFTCPQCGQVAALVDHTIEDDGTVQPSVVCPYAGCSFHEFIALERWPGRDVQ